MPDRTFSRAVAGTLARPVEPIFVVGVSRSGTTLLAAMLNAHSRISCAAETFFFPRLARTRVEEIIGDPAWPNRAATFLTSIRLGGSDVRVHELFNRSRDQITADLSNLPRSVPSLLEVLTGARARAEGKARWAEKTPNHLLFLEDLRRHYPRAPIVRIVRDPRDVALSLTRVPFGSPSKLANLYLWLERDEQSWRFFESDPHSMTLKYEQLVTDPRAELSRICNFIGEEFEEQMLRTEAAEGLATSIEWWKERAKKPVDGSRAGRWRRKYSAGEAATARLICHDALARYGYEPRGPVPPTIRLHPLTKEFIERHEDVLLELAAAGVRIERWTWPRSGLSQADDGRQTVFWGLPGELRWQLGSTLTQRFAHIIDLVIFLTRRTLLGRRPIWVREPSGGGNDAGWAERACSMLLRAAAQQRTATGAKELVTDTCQSRTESENAL